MSSKTPAKGKSSPASKEPRYIGVSIQQFLDGVAEDAKASRYDDGTAMQPEVREALLKVSKSFGNTQLRISHYVFCFSRGCFIRVNF